MRKILFVILIMFFSISSYSYIEANSVTNVITKIEISEEEEIINAFISYDDRYVIALIEDDYIGDSGYTLTSNSLCFFDITTGEEINRIYLGNNIFDFSISHSKQYVAFLKDSNTTLVIYDVLNGVKDEIQLPNSYRIQSFTIDDSNIILCRDNPFLVELSSSILTMNEWEIYSYNIVEKEFELLKHITTNYSTTTVYQRNKLFVSPNLSQVIYNSIVEENNYRTELFVEEVENNNILTRYDFMLSSARIKDFSLGKGLVIFNGSFLFENHFRGGFLVYSFKDQKIISKLVTPYSKGGKTFGTIFGSVITKDAQKMIAAYGDKAIRIYNLNTGDLVETYLYDKVMGDLHLLRDDKTLIVSVRNNLQGDYSYQVLDVDNGNITFKFTPDKFRHLYDVSYSNKYAIAAGGKSIIDLEKNALYVWDISKLLKNEHMRINLFLNNKLLIFDKIPIIRNDRTLLPLRNTSESLGVSVEWIPENKSIILKGENSTIHLYIGNNTATIDGKEYYLDSPPMLIDNTTYVPVRFISENFGATVEWDGDMRQIFISTKE